MKPGSILIVYEHRLFAQGLRQMLAGYGLKIREVRARSRRAEQVAQEIQPDVLIAECDEALGAAGHCLERLRNAAPAALLIQLSLRDDPIGPGDRRPLTATCREDLIEILETSLGARSREDTGR